MNPEQEERAAIMEIDGGLSREAAEKSAMAAKDEGSAVAHPNLEIRNRFLNAWVESISLVTDADPVLILFGGLGILSALLHKSFFYAPEKTHLNLYLFNLGPSSAPRKTTVINIVGRYLRDVAPDLILPDEFTSESLTACLAVQNHGTILSRELNHFLEQVLGPEYNKGLSSGLGNIYDGTPYKRFTKQDGFVEVKDPVLTIVGAGVDQFLVAKLKKIDFVSGFWPRVTLIRLKDRPVREWRAPGFFTPLPPILDQLRKINAVKGGEIGYLEIQPGLVPYIAQLHEEAKTLKNPNLVIAYLRLEWILIKIAALLELADRPESKTISPEAFDDAVILTDYIRTGLPTFYEERLRESEEAKLAAWALDLIKKRDKDGALWVPYRTILRHSNADTQKLKTALERLLVTEECEQTDIPATKLGGRPGKAYRSIK